VIKAITSHRNEGDTSVNVMTVCGEIPPAQIGGTQLPEHVLVNADIDGNDYNLRMSKSQWRSKC
jgi:predicted metal-dependent phosphotriesterase family hydrolase